jgi:DedD protein
MDSRAKQRLTGAVILVALFVLLVPELLTGPKNPPSGAGAPADEGLRRYTIDLDAPGANGTPASGQPAMNPPAEASVNLPVVEAPMGAQADRAVPGEAAIPEPTPAVAMPAPAVAQTPAPIAKPAAQSTPAATVKPTPAASAPVVTAPAATTPANTPAAPKPTPTATPAKPGTFVVQLGSFGSRENAERLVRDMTAKGFATFIAPITTNGRELYRVRVGPTRDRPSAEALAAQLKRMGQSGSIVPIS